jgi:predicted acyltransferase
METSAAMDSKPETAGQTVCEKVVATGGRLMSLDALRGFDMFWIMGGDWIVHHLNRVCQSPVTGWMSRQLEHAKWEGFTFEDIIMPLFLFIVGTAMPFSFGKHLAGGQTKARMYLHIVKRVIILWILGMMVQGHLLSYDWTKFKLTATPFRRLPPVTSSPPLYCSTSKSAGRSSSPAA